MTNDNAIPTLIERFYHWEATTPDSVFLRQPAAGEWTEITYAEAGQQIRRMVTALKAKGLKPGDHVGIYSKNCYHWVLADLAIHMGGYVSTPYYASLPGDQLAQVISLSDIKALFVGKLDAWDEERRDAIPDDVLTIRFPDYPSSVSADLGIGWDDLMAEHEPAAENYVPDLDGLWTIKFTSGTTGTPKGVMHSQRNLSNCILLDAEHVWSGISKVEHPRYMSYLPLNHIAERAGVELPAIWMGGSLSFTEKLETFQSDMQATQPTFFFGVPRVWTKFYQGVTSMIPAEQLDAMLSNPNTAGPIRDQIRAGLGFRDLELAATGAAITPAYIKEFFAKLGIHLIEAYGMTESCGAFTNGVSPDTPADSVGMTVPWGETKIDPDTKEILYKSQLMMQGYYKNPEKTAEIMQDGWMKTGDVGEKDENGQLRIVGRINDAFKTAKGSFVTPNPLEEVLGQSDYIEQACVVGLGIPQPIALVNLSPAGFQAEPATVAAEIAERLESLNSTRANYERISTVVIQAEPWSPDSGLLTPTLKLKRHEFDKTFGEQYADWHADNETVIWT